VSLFLDSAPVPCLTLWHSG